MQDSGRRPERLTEIDRNKAKAEAEEAVEEIKM
jgi:hypothetical protein